MKNIITKFFFIAVLLLLVSCNDKYEGIWVEDKCFIHKQIGSPSINSFTCGCPLKRIVIKKDGNNYIIKKQDYQIKFWNTNFKGFFELRENKLVNIDYPSSFDNYQLGKDNTLVGYNVVYHKID